MLPFYQVTQFISMGYGLISLLERYKQKSLTKSHYLSGSRMLLLLNVSNICSYLSLCLSLSSTLLEEP